MADEKAKEPAIIKYLPAIIVVVGLLYAGAAYFLLFMPKIGRLMTGGALDVRPLEARLGDYRDYLTEITDEKERFSQINSAYLRKVRNMLPDWQDNPNLYVQMEQLAQSNGMVLASIDTIPDDGPPGPDGVKQVRVSLSLMGGTYKEFKSFLASLEDLVRVSDIESLTFSSGDTNYNVILTAYYIEPGFQPSPAAPAEPLLPDTL